ncbi:helix-turn-helix domain-containing protein [Streptomyces bacillaris]|uniref:helix-turn-helix domain-containing protein n=1 Tax=Streptomyces bacillaris TaxID=68179 RepID=UPI0036354D23
MSRDARAAARTEAARLYASTSIRGVAASLDLSYGTARALLLEARVKLRGRGGARVRRS